MFENILSRLNLLRTTVRKVSIPSGEINTRADAEAVFVASPHARAGVSDGRHVGVHLHGAQGVLRYTVI